MKPRAGDPETGEAAALLPKRAHSTGCHIPKHRFSAIGRNANVASGDGMARGQVSGPIRFPSGRSMRLSGCSADHRFDSRPAAARSPAPRGCRARASLGVGDGNRVRLRHPHAPGGSRRLTSLPRRRSEPPAVAPTQGGCALGESPT